MPTTQRVWSASWHPVPTVCVYWIIWEPSRALSTWSEKVAAMNKPTRWIIALVWLTLAVVGVDGLVERLLHGHHQAAYGSYVVWGLWVSAYIYFIGLSAGSFLLSSLIYVFGVQKLERIGRLSLFVAIITLLMALLSLWFGLGGG